MEPCRFYLKHYITDFKAGLKSIESEFPSFYHELTDVVSRDGRSPSDFPKLMKGGNPNAILKFLSFVIVVLAFYYGKNPIGYFNTSIGKTLEAAKSIESILGRCSNTSNTELDPSVWGITLNGRPPEQNTFPDERVLQIHTGIDKYPLAAPLIIAMMEHELKKANPRLNLPNYRKYPNAVIDVFNALVLLNENVLYINFEQTMGTRCNSPEFDQECNFFNGFKEVSSIENTEKFISQNKIMISILISKIFDLYGSGLINRNDFMRAIDSLIVLRETSRGGGMHTDTTNANTHGIAAFANKVPVISTEFIPNPGNLLDFIGSNTLPHDIPAISPLRIMIPPYSTLVWKENGGRKKRKDGKRVTETLIYHAAPNEKGTPKFEERLRGKIQEELEMDGKLTNRQVDAAMKISNKDKKGRIIDESTVDNLDYRPQFVFSEVKHYDPDAFEAERVIELSDERQNSLYGNEFLKHIEEITPTDFFPSYYTDSTLTIIIEGVEIPKGSLLHRMIVTAMKMGENLNELSKETTKNVNRIGLFDLFTGNEIIKTRENAHEALFSKKIKGGKSLKKKRRTKKR